MKEETAIEWLIRVLELETFENINLYSMNAIEQAKEMEAIQRESDYNHGYMDGHNTLAKWIEDTAKQKLKDESKTNI